MHTGKETGERVAFRDWGFGAVAIGAASQNGPLACVGQANGPLSVSGRFAKAPRWLLGVLLYSQENAVYDDSYFQKNAVLGDFYLLKSAEFS